MRNGGPDKKLWQNYRILNFYLRITGIRKIRENYENGKIIYGQSSSNIYLLFWESTHTFLKILVQMTFDTIFNQISQIFWNHLNRIKLTHR